MEFRSYGDAKGKLVFYFHGAPGAMEEAQFLDAAAKQHHLNILCLHRFSIDSDILDNAYHQLLADKIVTHMATHESQPQQVDLIGFSIGSHVVLEVANCLADKVGQVHLVSSAAPLDAGDFLPHMAGKPVFQLAQNAPKVLSLLTYWQFLITQLSPRWVFNMLFASAQGRDQNLVNDKGFQSTLTQVLAACFKHDRAGYVRDVISYAKPWQDRLPTFKAATHLWHGSADNWSPLAMAHLLESRLPNCQGKHVLEGASHYSCLLEAADQICQTIADRH